MRLYSIMRVAGAISSWPTFRTAAKKKDVDARDKPGHDVERFVFRH